MTAVECLQDAVNLASRIYPVLSEMLIPGGSKSESYTARSFESSAPCRVDVLSAKDYLERSISWCAQQVRSVAA